MKKLSLACVAAMVMVSCQESMETLTERVFVFAEQQCLLMEQQLSDTNTPRTYTPQGVFVTASLSWWCSGFYPGTLWMVYNQTGNESIREFAEKNSRKLADVEACQSSHDLGFQYWNSYGRAYQTTLDTSWLPVIEDASRRLAERFSPKVGCIRSWGALNETRNFKVIIDNMMNLALLMEASKLFSCDSLAEIANTHAHTTMANHFRSDYTSYHVLDYDQETGAVKRKMTAQGYADESAWARGQAWGLYGYTMMYRETGDEDYLDMAQKIADSIIPMLPEDAVPYWDFNCPAIPYTYRDASAAAIMASALVELSTFVTDKSRSKFYLATAERQLRSLASPEYMAEKPGSNGCFILRHSTGNLHGDGSNRILETDAPLTYADYYFLEALIRYRNLK